MTDASKILDGLADALRAARRAARRYGRHAELCGAWDLPQFGEERRAEADGELRLAELIESRIRALRGEAERPEPDGPPTLTDLLERDLRGERDHFRRFQQLARLCRTADDAETLELAESSMLDAEVRIERLEGQLDLIDEIGEGEYRRQCADAVQFC